MTTRYANPSPDDINGSDLCAQYVRNSGEMWDVIVLVSNGPFNSLTDYVNGTKTMKVYVFSPLLVSQSKSLRRLCICWCGKLP